MTSDKAVLRKVLEKITGPERADRLFKVLVIHPAIAEDSGPKVSRAVIAQALNMLLFEDLLARVPAAKLYVERCLAEGKTVLHDHGAVRTVALAGMGALPVGELAITRILRPLGYALNGLYPLERLRMTGRSHAQSDFPEEIAQFFISELHPERFSPEFLAAVHRVTATSIDPVTPQAEALLRKLEDTHSLTVEEAATLLPILVSCFGRQHQEATLADYEILLAESPEMAWISTEGNAFNHATDRVSDLDDLVAEQRLHARPLKDTIETSRSGRVRQTAFRADLVEREFIDAHGGVVHRRVPGSFYEFIQRGRLCDPVTGVSRLDLAFDSSNAQGIFKMTAAA